MFNNPLGIICISLFTLVTRGIRAKFEYSRGCTVQNISSSGYQQFIACATTTSFNLPRWAMHINLFKIQNPRNLH